TFTATVTGSSGTPTGSVQFIVDGTNFGGLVGLSGGHASIGISSFSVGSHVVSATYDGDASFNGSTSLAIAQTVIQVKRGRTTAVTSSVNPSGLGQSVTFTATVTGASGTPTGSVQFIVDGNNFGGPIGLSGSTASISISSLSVGNHTISASYGGDTNFSASAS